MTDTVLFYSCSKELSPEDISSRDHSSRDHSSNFKDISPDSKSNPRLVYLTHTPIPKDKYEDFLELKYLIRLTKESFYNTDTKKTEYYIKITYGHDLIKTREYTVLVYLDYDIMGIYRLLKIFILTTNIFNSLKIVLIMNPIY